MAICSTSPNIFTVVDYLADDAIDQSSSPENLAAHRRFHKTLDSTCLRFVEGRTPTTFEIVALPSPAMKRCEVEALRGLSTGDNEIRGNALLETVFAASCSAVSNLDDDGERHTFTHSTDGGFIVPESIIKRIPLSTQRRIGELALKAANGLISRARVEVEEGAAPLEPLSDERSTDLPK